MARIRIISSSHHGTVPLNLNGEVFIMAVPADGGEATVPDRFLGVLDGSNMVYEIVATGDGNDEAGAGARGDSGATSAEPHGDGPLNPEPVPGPIPTPGVESPTFDASSNTAMPASPPNPSPSAPAPGESPPKPKAAKRKRAAKPKAPAEPKAK